MREYALAWEMLAMGTPGVATLHRHACPNAILRTIWSIVIHALDGKSFWAWPHIGIECLKRIVPSCTNSDASAAIIMKTAIVRIVASLLHHIPNVPFTNHLAFSGASMRCASRNDLLSPETAATRAASVAQRRTIDRLDCPAVTTANPSSPAKAFDDRPSTKSISCDIDESSHSLSLR